MNVTNTVNFIRSIRWILIFVMLLSPVHLQTVTNVGANTTPTPPQGLDWNVSYAPYKNTAGSVITDPKSDITSQAFGFQSPAMFDIHGGTGNAASVFYGIKNENVYFRFSLADDPRSELNGGFFNSFRAVVQILSPAGKLLGSVGVNGSDPSSDYSFVSVIDAETNKTTTQKLFEFPFAQNLSQDGVRVTRNETTGTFFLDFQVPISELETVIGLNPNQDRVKLVYGTSMRGGITDITRDSILNGSSTHENLSLISFKTTDVQLSTGIQTIVAGSNPPYAGVEQTYDLTYSISNSGMTPTETVKVVDTLSSDVKIVTLATTGLTVNDNFFEWNVGVLQSLETKSLTLRVSFTPESVDEGLPFNISTEAYAEITTGEGPEYAEPAADLTTGEVKGGLTVNITNDDSALDDIVTQVANPIIRGTTNAPDGEKITVKITGGTTNRTFTVNAKGGKWSQALGSSVSLSLVSGIKYTIEAGIGGVTDTQTLRFVSSEYSLRFDDKVGSSTDAYMQTNNTELIIGGVTSAPVDAVVTVGFGETYVDAIVVRNEGATSNTWSTEMDLASLGLADGTYLFEAYVEGRQLNPEDSTKSNLVYANLLIELDTTAPELLLDEDQLVNNISDKPLLSGTANADTGDDITLIIDANQDSEFQAGLPDHRYTTKVSNGTWSIQLDKAIPRGQQTAAKITITDKIGNSSENDFYISPTETEVFLKVDGAGSSMVFTDQSVTLTGETNAETNKPLMLQLRDVLTNETTTYYSAVDADSKWEFILVDADLNGDYLRNGNYSYIISFLEPRYAAIRASGTFRVNAGLPTLKLDEFSQNINVANKTLKVTGSVVAAEPDKYQGNTVQIILSSSTNATQRFVYNRLVDDAGKFSLSQELNIPAGSYRISAQLEDSAFNVVTLSPSTTLIQADFQPPTVPAGVTSQSITNNSISLRWTSSTDNRAVKEYQIFVNNQLMARTTTSNFVLTGLKEFTNYSIQLVAVDTADNQSAKSVAVSLRTTDRTAPTVPSNLTRSEMKENSFRVSWRASTDAGGSGVAGYEVFLDNVLRDNKLAPTATSYVFTGLIPEKSYTVTIRARDVAGNVTAFTAPFTVSTGKDVTPPTAPPGDPVSSLIRSDSFRITWPNSTDNVAVTGYEIFVNGVLRLDTKSTATTATLSGLKNFSLNNVKIRAYDKNRNLSPFNKEISVRTLDIIKPLPPTGLKASFINLRTVRLTWAASADDSGIAAYDIYIDGVKRGTTKLLTFDVVGLTTQTARFQVVAIDNSKNSSVLSPAVVYTRPPVLEVKGTTLLYNGRQLTLPTGITPVTRNGATFVPYRPVFDAMGLRTVVDTRSKQITATRTGYKVQFVPASRTYLVNDRTTRTLTVASYDNRGTLMMPVKFFEQEFGFRVIVTAK